MSSTFSNFFCRPTRHTSVCFFVLSFAQRSQQTGHKKDSRLDCHPYVSALPIFPGRRQPSIFGASAQAVASQVFSAQVSLTAVFGMGTGGPSLQSAPTIQFPKTWPPWTNQQGVCPWKRKSNVGNELSRWRGSERSAVCF